MVFEFGDHLMTEDAIIGFAQQFDPQPFHTERHPPEDAAHPTLIASGWHTSAATMRMMVDHFISRRNALPSPGVDEIRFVRPVSPGDRLHVKLIVTSVRPSASKPDRGIVGISLETLNQRAEVVLRMNVPMIIRQGPSHKQ